MRLSPRDFTMGLLLVLALGASGCQPIQPIAGSSATADTSTEVESVPMTDTATLSPADAMTSPITGTIAATVTSPSSVVTATMEVTGSAETSSTAANDPAEPELSSDPAVLAAGLAVYRAQYCGVCHLLDAAETRGTFGPPHNGMAAIAAERLSDSAYTGAATTPAEYIYESIVDPQIYLVPGYATTQHRMPSFAHLDEASLDALVAFLLAN